jgi:hypothetical protein
MINTDFDADAYSFMISIAVITIYNMARWWWRDMKGK